MASKRTRQRSRPPLPQSAGLHLPRCKSARRRCGVSCIPKPDRPEYRRKTFRRKSACRSSTWLRGSSPARHPSTRGALALESQASNLRQESVIVDFLIACELTRAVSGHAHQITHLGVADQMMNTVQHIRCAEGSVPLRWNRRQLEVPIRCDIRVNKVARQHCSRRAERAREPGDCNVTEPSGCEERRVNDLACAVFRNKYVGHICAVEVADVLIVDLVADAVGLVAARLVAVTRLSED